MTLAHFHRLRVGDRVTLINPRKCHLDMRGLLPEPHPLKHTAPAGTTGVISSVGRRVRIQFPQEPIHFTDFTGRANRVVQQVSASPSDLE